MDPKTANQADQPEMPTTSDSGVSVSPDAGMPLASQTGGVAADPATPVAGATPTVSAAPAGLVNPAEAAPSAFSPAPSAPVENTPVAGYGVSGQTDISGVPAEPVATPTSTDVPPPAATDQQLASHADDVKKKFPVVGVSLLVFLILIAVAIYMFL